jgi:hypothetical protein
MTRIVPNNNQAFNALGDDVLIFALTPIVLTPIVLKGIW